MIFAAGLGTRMGELTRETPKPMLPLMGAPLIDHAIRHIKDANASPIVANVHYLADRIRPYLEERALSVSDESSRLLDTGGGLKAALPMLGSSPVITLNSDAVFAGPNPIVHLAEAWDDGMDALLLLVPGERAMARAGGGDFSLTSGVIQRGGAYVYTGAQIIRTETVQEQDREIFSLNVVWDGLMRRGRVAGVVYPGTWCDVGHPDGLFEAERLLSGHV